MVNEGEADEARNRGKRRCDDGVSGGLEDEPDAVRALLLEPVIDVGGAIDSDAERCRQHDHVEEPNLEIVGPHDAERDEDACDKAGEANHGGEEVAEVEQQDDDKAQHDEPEQLLAVRLHIANDIGENEAAGRDLHIARRGGNGAVELLELGDIL